MPIDTDNLKSRIDLADLAGAYVTLHRESSREWAGPCPKCGGYDRFHVAADWFFCRQCHPDKGDAIEFVKWLRGCDFVEAVAILSGGAAVAPAPRKETERNGKKLGASLPTWTATRLANSQERLTNSRAGAPGREYLIGRGLTPATWRKFGLGFDAAVSVPGTRGESKAGAIAIPWYDLRGELVGVRYRFLEVQAGRKLTAMSGSTFAGNMFGAHLLTPSASATLVICEGELNAMSIAQVAGESHLDTLSLGSEGSGITEQIVDLATHYGAVIAWLDKPENALRVAEKIPGALARKSLDGLDANDRLLRGELGGMVAAARLKLCQDDNDRLNLLYALYDAGLTPTGLAAGAAAFVRRLAADLGQDITVREVGGAWFTGKQGSD